MPSYFFGRGITREKTVQVQSLRGYRYHILDELGGKKGEVIIPQKKISDALHISKGTISRNLRRLRDGGYIDIHPTYHSDGGRAANKYRMR